jgi:hypothetical protein
VEIRLTDSLGAVTWTLWRRTGTQVATGQVGAADADSFRRAFEAALARGAQLRQQEPGQ